MASLWDTIETSLTGGLVALLRTDRLVLLVGLSLGIAVLLLLRASQVWRYRQAFGYSVYHADLLRRWLLRWAALGSVTVLGIGLGYIWRSMPGGLDESEVVLATVPAELPQHLVIPRLGLDAPLVEAGFAGWQWDLSLLHDRVGHLTGTARPGQAGNAVLAGHVTLAEGGWGPFAELSSLRQGDQVFIVEGAHTWAYEVVDIRMVVPAEVSVAFATPDTRLTLITCADWSEADAAYLRRQVIVARPVPASPSPPSSP